MAACGPGVHLAPPDPQAHASPPCPSSRLESQHEAWIPPPSLDTRPGKRKKGSAATAGSRENKSYFSLGPFVGASLFFLLSWRVSHNQGSEVRKEGGQNPWIKWDSVPYSFLYLGSLIVAPSSGRRFMRFQSKIGGQGWGKERKRRNARQLEQL